METRSNILLVAMVGGLLIAGLLAFTYYLAFGTGSYDARYDIRFRKSVSGLEQGGAVTLSGVTVGRVSSIRLDPRNPGDSLVTVALDEELPIRSGVRADISRSLMDGSAQLFLIPSSEGILVNPKGRENGVIAAVGGSRSRDPAREAMDVTAKLDQAVRSLDSSGQKKVAETLAEAAGRTAGWERAVSDFADGISLRNLERAALSIADVGDGAERLQRTVESSRDDVVRLRSEIREFGNGARDFAETVEAQRDSVRKASRQLQGVNKAVQEAGDGISSVRDTVEKGLPEDR
ncbi:MAG TPA: MlaD family protein [Sphingomicrobium sp.]|nr:MlaD family protein [Sphingomicrobium sp.]